MVQIDSEANDDGDFPEIEEQESSAGSPEERENEDDEDAHSRTSSNVDVGEGTFSPPLYRQRYKAVFSILELQDKPLKRILDVGCAESSFISTYLKKLPDVEEIVGVDIDEFVLEEGRHRTAPLLYEHLHPRKKTLDIYLLQGDIGKVDERLIGVDAVSAIEFIEHLLPETLDSFRQTIFGFIRPPLCVISTPNVEYNVLFPDNEGFRHPDHKFEWTRAEFKSWCEGILEDFPDYSVAYSGVGVSSERPDLGPCSQIATFTRPLTELYRAVSTIRDTIETSTPVYKTLVHHSYPIDKDTRSFEEKLIDNLEYYINDCCRCRPAWENEENDYLSLSFLAKFSRISELTEDLEVIRKILVDNSWEVVTQDGEDHVVVPPMMEEYLPSSSQSYCSDDYDDYNPDDFYEPELNRYILGGGEFWD